MKFKILDCTLRDGGYYNNWFFSKNLTQDYLNAMSKSGIRYIELGFRSPKKNIYKGPNWYTSDEYLKKLSIPKNVDIGVMVNVFEIVSNSNGIKKTTDLLFKNVKLSKVKFVRLASHLKEIDNAFKICAILKKKGYKVAVNLMQISEQSEKNIVEVGKKAAKSKPDILYFADSLGSMNEKKIFEVIKSLKTFWSGALGIHTHDNLGKALSNSIFSMRNNVTWVDSTVTGMGRGPGNAKTETLILEMNNLQKSNFDLLPILKIINDHFNKMKVFYKWGTNPFYYLAGKYSIHPTYIQEMLSQKIDNSKILKIINQLKDGLGKKYDVNLIRSEFQKPIKIIKGNWKPKINIKNKEILLIANGNNLPNYKKSIEKYIKEKKPIVIALKPKIKINKKLINYYIACNPLRIMGESSSYSSLNKPLIIPQSLLSDSIKNKFSKVKTLNFGIGLKQNNFNFMDNGAIIPKFYTLSYALAVVTSGCSKKILLAGFDGYGKDDQRNKVIDEIFDIYKKTKKSLSITFLTPSSYNFSKNITNEFQK
jgi:4-hydroxy 2-oxovalerate aldolase